MCGFAAVAPERTDIPPAIMDCQRLLYTSKASSEVITSPLLSPMSVALMGRSSQLTRKALSRGKHWNCKDAKECSIPLGEGGKA